MSVSHGSTNNKTEILVHKCSFMGKFQQEQETDNGGEALPGKGSSSTTAGALAAELLSSFHWREGGGEGALPAGGGQSEGWG